MTAKVWLGGVWALTCVSSRRLAMTVKALGGTKTANLDVGEDCTAGLRCSKQVRRLSQGTGYGRRRRLESTEALKPARGHGWGLRTPVRGTVVLVVVVGVVVVVVVVYSVGVAVMWGVGVWAGIHTSPTAPLRLLPRSMGHRPRPCPTPAGGLAPKGGWRWQWDGPSPSVPAFSRRSSRNKGNGRVCRQGV